MGVAEASRAVLTKIREVVGTTLDAVTVAVLLGITGVVEVPPPTITVEALQST